MTAKPLSELFGYNAQEGTFAGNFSLNRATRSLSFDVETDDFSTEAAAALKEFLLEKYPFLKDISINRFFKTQDIDAHWQALIEELAEHSLMSAQIIGEGERRFQNGTLFVAVPVGFLFFLESKKCAKILENIIATRMKMNVHIVFEESPNAKFSSRAFYRISEPVLPVKEEAALISVFTPPIKREQHERPQNTHSFSGKPRRSRKLKISQMINAAVTSLNSPLEPDDDICIDGKIFALDERETKNGKMLYILSITDGKGSITVKMFTEKEDITPELKNLLKTEKSIRIFGKTQFDEFSKEVVIMANEISAGEYSKQPRNDNYEGKKRVELHLHTRMSRMDAVTGAADYFKRAKLWGHNAVAVTDHGVVQAFPEVFKAAESTDVKPIYGMEAYIFDDITTIVSLPKERTLHDNFVVFDVETTGLDCSKERIIEIGAVKIESGEITATFSEFINPNMILPAEIVKLTGITDNMLKNAPPASEVIPRFLEFIGECVVVAHNARFDVSFISAEAHRLGVMFRNSSFCTLAAAQTLFKSLPNHKLDTITKHLHIHLANHHRAKDDAAATAEVFLKMRDIFIEKNITSLKDANLFAQREINTKKLKKYFHAVILVKNEQGLRNLYELVSESHVNHFFKRPRIPKTMLNRMREGLIVGTACEAGEFFRAVFEHAPEEVIDELAAFYDYFEIQPVANNMFLVRENRAADVNELKELNKKIVAYGEKYNKLVVATTDCHFLDPDDEIFRRIVLSGEGFKNADSPTPLFFRTTEEMLEEFSYLGKEKAYEVVVENTNKIADMCNKIRPIPSGTFPPEIPGAEKDIEEITLNKAKSLYGENFPDVVRERINKELASIIKNGFSVMYIVAQKLVLNSVSNGYLVGSRGSVGSSLVATLTDITEVNPLPPHYYCPKCKYSDFDSPEVKKFAGNSGCDMPDKLCPVCGTNLKKDGHDIQFETFLGFHGEKEPDIDLNFSGEYQAKAHAYTEEMFGTGYVFKVGTVGALAKKTAEGYVRKYAEERGLALNNAERTRLAAGITGVKKTTGQHPGGLLVVPKNHSIYEFSPIQYPANDVKSGTLTTHFDYDFIHGALLKLDILGHDVPTIIRMLQDLTGIDPTTVDLGDKEVISLFRSPEALGVTTEQINCQTGSLGLPEFGTPIVRRMLLDTMPQTFSELIRICGLAHGTDVWFNNAQTLVKNGTATLSQVAASRDDIMNYLIIMGVDKQLSFKIMENVRKGKGITPEQEEILKNSNVPDWYINSCKKIQYLFPKAHATAYVMMTFRIGWFKIHYPEAYYAAIFSVKSGDFDYDIMCKGTDLVKAEQARIIALDKDATQKEKDVVSILENLIEMYARGVSFAPIDIYESDAVKFKLTKDKKLLPPLCVISGLGESAAKTLAAERQKGEFFSVEDLKSRAKLTKAVVGLLQENGIIKGLSETNQISIFNL
ncbi:MAG: PolC-type DNA polymerase III [Clostridiales bacterium]|jgi:DNA polymerase-3 subunit alpha (Gram-positive type)|nr:PolC-type DNA polymerase III [Clostridiales bacterium]